MVHSLLLATVACWWFGKTPCVQVCMTKGLTCPETVKQRLCVMSRIKTRLLNNRISYNSVVATGANDQSSLYCAVTSTGVMSDNTGCHKGSWGGGCSKTSVYTGQFRWASTIWSILLVAGAFAALARTRSHETCVECRQPEIMCMELWSWVSMRLMWLLIYHLNSQLKICISVF